MSAIIPFYFSNSLIGPISTFNLPNNYVQQYQLVYILPNSIIYLCLIIYFIYYLIQIHIYYNNCHKLTTSSHQFQKLTDYAKCINSGADSADTIDIPDYSNYYLTMFNWYTEIINSPDNSNYNIFHPTTVAILDAEEHNKYIQIIRDLSLNTRISSLNNHIIQYFIFYKHGTYICQNAECKNAYDDFLDMRDYHGNANFYLDDYTEPIRTPHIKLMLTDGEFVYTSTGELNFIEWLVDSGIYTYLLCDKNMRYLILEEMIKLKLIKGNDFLYFHLIEEKPIDDDITEASDVDVQDDEVDEDGEDQDDEVDEVDEVDEDGEVQDDEESDVDVKDDEVDEDGEDQDDEESDVDIKDDDVDEDGEVQNDEEDDGDVQNDEEDDGDVQDDEEVDGVDGDVQDDEEVDGEVDDEVDGNGNVDGDVQNDDEVDGDVDGEVDDGDDEVDDEVDGDVQVNGEVDGEVDGDDDDDDEDDEDGEVQEDENNNNVFYSNQNIQNQSAHHKHPYNIDNSKHKTDPFDKINDTYLNKYLTKYLNKYINFRIPNVTIAITMLILTDFKNSTFALFTNIKTNIKTDINRVVDFLFS